MLESGHGLVPGSGGGVVREPTGPARKRLIIRPSGEATTKKHSPSTGGRPQGNGEGRQIVLQSGPGLAEART